MFKIIQKVVRDVKVNPDVLIYNNVRWDNFIYPVVLSILVGLSLFLGNVVFLKTLTIILLILSIISSVVWIFSIGIHREESKFKDGLTEESIKPYIKACGKLYLIKNNPTLMNISFFNQAVIIAFLSTQSIWIMGIFIFTSALGFYNIYLYSRMWEILNKIIDDKT